VSGRAGESAIGARPQANPNRDETKPAPRKSNKIQENPKESKGIQGKTLLDFLGFPWIPSSESGLFNGLRGNMTEKIPSRLPRRRLSPRDSFELPTVRRYHGFRFSERICRRLSHL